MVMDQIIANLDNKTAMHVLSTFAQVNSLFFWVMPFPNELVQPTPKL